MVVTMFTDESVQLPVIGEYVIHHGEGARRTLHTNDEFAVAVIKDSQIVGHSQYKFYSQITWYCITRRGSVVRCLTSVILLGEEVKEKDQNYHVNIIILWVHKRPGIYSRSSFFLIVGVGSHFTHLFIHFLIHVLISWYCGIIILHYPKRFNLNSCYIEKFLFVDTLQRCGPI